MLVIAVINQKGGVGKTTTTLNLAHALSLQKHRVTLIDLDPQGHLAASLGIYDSVQNGIDLALLGQQSVKDTVIQIRDCLQLVVAGHRLGEIEQYQNIPRDRLRSVLIDQFTDQVCVLIDCPPSSGLLVVNALVAANTALVPVVGDYLALHGLSYLMGTLKNFEVSLKKKIPFWLVLNRYQHRRRSDREIRDKLLEYFPGKILATPIRENVALAESPSFGKTIFEYRPHSAGAEDFRALAEDLLYQRMLGSRADK